jgi:hypothetical protein
MDGKKYYVGNTEIFKQYYGSNFTAVNLKQYIPQNFHLYIDAQEDFSGGDVSGSTWVDISSNSYDFTISGTKQNTTTPKYTEDGFVQGPFPTKGDTGTYDIIGSNNDDFTVGSWFNMREEVTGSTFRPLFSRLWDGGTVGGSYFTWGLLTNVEDSKIKGSVVFQGGSGSVVESDITINKDTWYHCVFQLKQQEHLKLFINGVERGSLDITGAPLGIRGLEALPGGAPQSAYTTWGIGRWNNPTSFTYTDQWVGAFGVYTQSLSSTEILNWYNNSKINYI